MALLEASLPLGSIVPIKTSVVTIEPEMLVVIIAASSVSVEDGTLYEVIAPAIVSVLSEPRSLVVKTEVDRRVDTTDPEATEAI